MGWMVRGLNPDGGKSFYTLPEQPGAHPAYAVGIGSYPGVKWQGLGIDHPPPYSAGVKERVSHTSTPPMGLHDLLKGDLYLYLSLFLFPAVIVIITLA